MTHSDHEHTLEDYRSSCLLLLSQLNNNVPGYFSSRLKGKLTDGDWDAVHR
uniref:Uncharacterized protein n=1 Tax=Anguilla anguilla TaxID=7936 RepID=A0A0E9PEJ0_ANGAN